MLTVKQGGIRVVNPDLMYMKTEEFNRESIFKILVMECGFQSSQRDDVWTHTKDDKFSVQFNPENDTVWFEYKYTSELCEYPTPISNKEFIEQFLMLSRKFFQKEAGDQDVDS